MIIPTALAIILTILLINFKILGVITWSWWFIFFPLWGTFWVAAICVSVVEFLRPRTIKI